MRRRDNLRRRAWTYPAPAGRLARVLLVIVATVLMGVPIAPVSAQDPPARLRLAPPIVSAEPVADVGLVLEDAPGIGRLEVALQFDAERFAVTAIQPGAALPPDALRYESGEVTGTLRIVVSAEGPRSVTATADASPEATEGGDPTGEPAATDGDGEDAPSGIIAEDTMVIARITFGALQEGTSPLTFDPAATTLTTPDGEGVPLEAVGEGQLRAVDPVEPERRREIIAESEALAAAGGLEDDTSGASVIATATRRVFGVILDVLRPDDSPTGATFAWVGVLIGACLVIAAGWYIGREEDIGGPGGDDDIGRRRDATARHGGP